MKSKQEMRKARCYISAPYYTEELQSHVSRIAEALDNNPFVVEYFSPAELSTRALLKKQYENMVYVNVIEYLNWADVLIAVVDPERDYDTAVAFEIGYAVAKGKPILLLQEKAGVICLEPRQSCHAYLQSIEQLETYNFLTTPEIAYPEGGTVTW